MIIKTKQYAAYVLVILTLVNVFNFIDRQILSILANDIKSDLGISDAQMGFLYGTAFAIFYSIFGIPAGKLADVWVRRTLIACGLSVWSLMTAASGLARSFASLAFLRIGVGVGEASASPAAYSLLADYFSPKVRATVLSIYSSGIFIGMGIGLFLGGLIVDNWNEAYPLKPEAPFQLAGWHVAFFVVGLPGLLLALLVMTIREPLRGSRENMVSESRERPLQSFLQELLAILPPFTLLSFYLHGAKKSHYRVNLLFAALCILICVSVIDSLGKEHTAQWVTLVFAFYAAFSWAQSLAQRDPVAFGMIFRCQSLVWSILGVSLLVFMTYSISFWMPSYFIRSTEVSKSELGLVLGLSMTFGGLLGTLVGGAVSDWLKTKTDRARPLVGMATACLASPALILTLSADNLQSAYVYNLFFIFFSTLYTGIGPTIVTDLVLPRIRAMASAFLVLAVNIIGLALGPYTVGLLSDLNISGGDEASALRTAMHVVLLAYLLAVGFLYLGSRHIGRDERNKFKVARDLGEDMGKLQVGSPATARG